MGRGGARTHIMATIQLIDGVILVRVNGAKREVRVISSDESHLMSDLSFEEKTIVNKMLSDAAEAEEAAAAAGAAGGCTAQLVGGTWTCVNNGCPGTCQLITTDYDSVQGMAVPSVLQ